MKMRVSVFFFGVIFLTACATSAGGASTATPDYSATDTANQIETAVAARATELAIEALITPTSTPAPLTVQELILTSTEANELANRWSDTPFDDTQSVVPEYCLVECVSFTWQGGAQGDSLLDITLIKANSRDEAATILAELKSNFVSGTAVELTLPELVSLPDDTFAFEAQTTQLELLKGVLARRGAIVILIGLNMPDLTEDENLLFLSLYADRQIQKLIAAGY